MPFNTGSGPPPLQPHVEYERYLRRQAIQLAGYLPENQEDAERVLEYTRELLTSFLISDKKAALRIVTQDEHQAVVVGFPASESA